MASSNSNEHRTTMSFIHFNGSLIPAGQALLTADNRGLRYGDGLFETMKVVNGKLQLAPLHFERLFRGLSLLQFELPAFFTPAYLTERILEVCQKNNIAQHARVRLNLFRGNGGLYEPENLHPNLIIEAWALPEQTPSFNENGLIIDVYQDAQKSCDVFANIKSNNYLPYVMAALHAKKNEWNDCLLINIHNRICDSTIANVFWIKDQSIYTPPLTEGCVAGVMRQYLLNVSRQDQEISEQPLSIQALFNADEVFLTNAIQGIRWVKQCRDILYNNTITRRIFDQYLKEIP